METEMTDTNNTTQDLNPTEEWRDVVGYEGNYIISESGVVVRAKATRGAVLGKRLKPCTDKGGYVRVKLFLNGVHKYHSLHCLVAAAFIGERPQGLDINHIDGNKANAHFSNLEYVTRRENIRHASAMGLMATGDRSGARTHPESYRKDGAYCNARLSEDDVRRIHTLHKQGVAQKELALMFGVVPHHISNILSRKKWKHI